MSNRFRRAWPELPVGWFHRFLDSAGTAPLIRWCIAGSELASGLLTAVMVFLGPGALTGFQLGAVCTVIVINGGYALRWVMGTWPGPRSSWVFIGAMNVSIVLSCWVDPGPLTGIGGVAALGLLACYCAVSHGPGTLAIQALVSAVVLGSLAVRVGDSGGGMVAAVVKASVIGLVLIVPSVIIHLVAAQLAVDALHAGFDPLTGVLNRRGLTTELDGLTFGGPGEVLVVAVIDIDWFKAINDRFGHAMGDRVLTEVAHRLRTLHPEGLVGRIGGEEFVFAQRVEQSAAGDVGQSLRAAIAQVSALAVTASIGLVHTGRPELASWQLIAIADKVMYQAKRAGKDRAIVIDLDVDSGPSQRTIRIVR